ncbi:MAG: hypothetical protein ACI9UA_002172, partial [Pseudoalteromonas tetraodonis]
PSSSASKLSLTAMISLRTGENPAFAIGWRDKNVRIDTIQHELVFIFGGGEAGASTRYYFISKGGRWGIGNGTPLVGCPDQPESKY